MSHVHGREGHHYFVDGFSGLPSGGVGPSPEQPRTLPENLTDPSLDRLASLAANSTGCPVARISLVDDSWVVCRASVGAPRLIVPAKQSLCARAKSLGQALQVNFPATDPRFADLCTLPHNQGTKFYAAQPLVRSDGSLIGILSLRDVLPHTLDQSELATLQDIAALAVERLEYLAHAQSMSDDDIAARILHLADHGAQLASWRYDRFSRRLVWSDSLYDLLGQPRDSNASFRRFLNGMTLTERKRVRHLVSRSLRRGKSFTFETLIRRPDGQTLSLMVHGDCIPTSESKDQHHHSVFGIAYPTKQ